ncbi:MAG: VC_2705 family sodium/solute symporter, partial [Spirochaetota bacterium]|nr:VC_2705 family sodium/solute symporter [Spirochaetota bacterium]
LDKSLVDIGLPAFTERGSKSMIDVFMITFALMVGTAGLPHVIIRFFTVPKVKDARVSAGWALLFIALLYTTAPAVAAFARYNMIETVHNVEYKSAPQWFKNWEVTGLIAWRDKNNDGKMQMGKGEPFKGKPVYSDKRGAHGEKVVTNAPAGGPNELYVDRDIMVLANPEIAKLPNWVIALVAAGGLAAALSTAAGLLLVISTSLAHDLLKKVVLRDKLNEKKELMAARIAAGFAVLLAGLLGIYPLGFVAQVVAFAFGLAASSFFPAIILGIFSKKMNKEGAISGMIVGILFTAGYIIYFKFINPTANKPENWLWGISPEGIGTIGMVLNFIVSIVVSKFTKEVPENIQHLIENIRVPRELEK